MAEKVLKDTTPLITDEVTKAQLEFNKAIYEFGLDMIDGYKAGKYRNSGDILDAIVRIFEEQPKPVTQRE